MDILFSFQIYFQNKIILGSNFNILNPDILFFQNRQCADKMKFRSLII